MQYTQGVSYEIILVDNASAECDADLFLKEFPTIKLIKSKENTGFTGGNNLGIKYTSAPYILLLNSDTELTEDSISKCHDIIKQDNSIGVITCKLVSPNGGVQKQCLRFPSIKLALIEMFRLHKFIPQPKRGILMSGGFFDHLSSIYVDSVWGTFFMFPSTVLERFPDKKLPGDFFMYSEDLEWCYAIKKMDYKIFYCASTSIIHYFGASSKSSVMHFKHKNEYNFVVGNYGWLYAKALVFVRALLYATKSFSTQYAKEVSRIYFKLFFYGGL